MPEFINETDSLPLTLDTYSIDVSTDNDFLDEFPALQAHTNPSQEKKPAKTEAQKEALRVLRSKFRYPTTDPGPNIYKDTRTELEKVESIIQIASQVLDGPNLEVWNTACERNLHLVKQHNSGIPLLQQNIKNQIKTFRLDKKHESELLRHSQDSFNNLFVPEDQADKISETEPQENLPEQKQSDLGRSLDDHDEIDTFAASTDPQPLLDEKGLSTILLQIWQRVIVTHLPNPTLANILHSNQYLLKSAISCLLPCYKYKRVLRRILRRWDRPKFVPNKKLCKKIAALLVRNDLLDKKTLKLYPVLIEANFASSESNVQCYVNDQQLTCCADSGAHRCIMSYETFRNLKFKSDMLNKKEVFNIKTATTLELDAVMGTFSLPLVFYNEMDGKPQSINQTFLVLRKHHTLAVPLLGTDFMKQNNGELRFQSASPVQLFLNGFQVGPKPQMIPIQFLQTKQSDCAPNLDIPALHFEHTPVNPIFTEPGSYDSEIPEIQITFENYMCMVQECRTEKIAQLVRTDPAHKNKSTIEINRIITENYESEYPQILQKNSMIPEGLSANNPNLKVNLDHLDKNTKELFNTVKNKYPKLYSQHKHHIGKFTAFSAQAIIDPTVSCFQRQRGKFLPQSAKDDLNLYFENGVFKQAIEGVDKYVCNITLTRRPQAKEERCQTRADKNIVKQREKEEQKNKRKPSQDYSSNLAEERTLYRLTIDMRQINLSTRNDTTLVLPSIQTIERSFHNSHISTYDLSNMFYGITLKEDSTQFFNFYVEDTIWGHERLPQGWTASPKFGKDAMVKTFSPETLQEWRQKNNISIVDFPPNDYSAFLVTFVDDLANHTPRKLPASYKGKLTAIEYHMMAMDATFYALHKHGWLISLRKSTILSDTFIFLGSTWNMKDESVGINNDRLQSILSWREPRSVPETSSRLSSLLYYENHALYLKRIAYPLIRMVKSGTFKWTEAESHSWHNILYIMALAIKTAIFNPNHILFLLVDTSAVESSHFLMQWHPEKCQLVVIRAKSHLLTTSERRQSPIHRESIGVHHVLDTARPYLLQTLCKKNFLFTDASSISYAARVRPFENFLFELSCTLSQYPTLEVIHTPGRVLSAPDLLTRQLNNVIFDREDTNLSKTQAHILPPLQDVIPPGTTIPNDILYRALNATPRAEYFDVSEKGQEYTQRVNWADYATEDQLYSSEKEWLLSALINHSDTTMKLDTVRDVFAIKSSNQAFKTKAGKLQFLDQVREKLKDLPANSMELQRIKSFINQQVSSLGGEAKHYTINTNYVITSLSPYSHCDECRALTGPIIKTSVSDSTFLIPKVQAIADLLNEDSLNEELAKYNLLTCKHALKYSATALLHQATELCASNVIMFKEDKMLLFYYHFQSEFCSLDVEEDLITFRTKKKFTIDPATVHHLDFMLHTRCTHTPILNLNETASLLISPNLFHDPLLNILNVSLFNTTRKDLVIEENTLLFSIQFSNVKSIMAIEEKSPKFVKEANQKKNVVNFAFLDILTRLIAKLGEDMDLQDATQVFGEYENIGTVSAHTAQCNTARQSRSRHPPTNNPATELSDAQMETRTLNSAFLLQSLLNKDFGLKSDHLRQMQEHDFYLQRKIMDIKQANKDADTNFKLYKGILYFCPPDRKPVICISNVIARSIIEHLHNGSMFHYPAGQMIQILQKLIFTKHMHKIAENVVATCAVCLLGKPKLVRKIMGSTRTYNYLPGQAWVLDSAIVPKSQSGHSKILIIADYCTSYISAYPSKDLKAATAKQHIMNHLCAHPTPQVIITDFGSEFKEGLQNALTQLNVALHATTPYQKGTSSTAENAIRLLKRALTKMCLYNTAHWPTYLPVVLSTINNSIFYKGTTRSALFFGPLHFRNIFNMTGFSDFPEELFSEQRDQLKEIIFRRKSNLMKHATTNPPVFRVNGYVTDHFLPQAHETGKSQELRPAVSGIYIIREVFPKRLRVTHFVTGEERTIPTELVKSVPTSHILDMSYNLQNAYISHHLHRLMSHNAYQGPDEKKIWKNTVFKKIEELSTRDKENNEKEETTNQKNIEDDEEDEEEKEKEYQKDPDSIKRTRSGAVYTAIPLEGQVHVPGILKKTGLFVHNYTTIAQIEPSAMSALQDGILNQDPPITPIQKAILRLGARKLFPQSQKIWMANPNKCTHERKVNFTHCNFVRTFDEKFSRPDKLVHADRTMSQREIAILLVDTDLPFIF